MNSFKVRLFASLATLLAFSLTFYTACQKDPCKDVSCLNGGTCEDGLCKCPTGFVGANCEINKCVGVVCAFGGTCVDGKCQCLPGYEGEQCETITRNKFKGVWVVTERGTQSAATQYMVTVEEATAVTELWIRNFKDTYTDENVLATVNLDTITIPEQMINGDTLSGKGLLSDDPRYGKYGKLMFRYKIRHKNGVVDDFGVSDGEPSLWNK